MAPFLIHHRDFIFFGPIDRPLKRGDMVFYQRDNGQYVMHRICRVNSASSTYDIIGDAQTEIERGVRSDQVFAVVFKVQRKGKLLGPESFWWKFFESVWLCVRPFRRVIMKLYPR